MLFKLVLVGKSGSGKTSLIKTAINALIEMGNRVEAEHIYLNTYTITELFGQSDAKPSCQREGLVCSTLKNFKSESDLNIVHLVGEVF